MLYLNMLKLVLLACLAVAPASSESSCCSENKYCCPVNWLGLHGHCYGYFVYPYTYEEARYYCVTMGGNLASIHSARENAILNAFVGGQQTWIGLNDLREEGTMEWVDGTEADFNNWDSNNPNDHNGNEDCAELSYPSHDSGTWNDGQCSWRHGFLCKK